MFVREFMDRFERQAMKLGDAYHKRTDVPVVVRIEGQPPQTITNVELEDHEEGGHTLWITVEES